MKSLLILTIGLFSVFSVGAVYEKPSAVPTAAAEVEPRADVYKWHYKTANGHLYKRLYNLTKKKWAGDWLLVS